MLNIKIKECAGWDENSHPAFIWKRIGGKPYCKECTFKLIPPKPIPYRSEKGKEKAKEDKKKTEDQFNFFLEIWEERKREDGRNYCEVTGERLPIEPLSIFFDHLLEKSTHPEYRFDRENIILVTFDVHQKKTNGSPLQEHQRRIEEFKKLKGIE